LIENVERAAAEGDVIEDAEEQDVEEIGEDGIYQTMTIKNCKDHDELL
jgi:hypothetical protein